MFWRAALLGFASTFAGCNSVSDRVVEEYQQKDAALAERKEADATQLQSAESSTSYGLHVKGMGCPLCATNVRKSLERVQGVESVNIDLGAGIVKVSAKANEAPQEGALRRAVANAGFQLAKVERL